jgi:hypothetical protein
MTDRLDNDAVAAIWNATTAVIQGFGDAEAFNILAARHLDAVSALAQARTILSRPDQQVTAISPMQRIAGAHADLAEIETTILASDVGIPDAAEFRKNLRAGPAGLSIPAEHALKKALTLLRPEFTEVDNQRRYPRAADSVPLRRRNAGPNPDHVVESKVWAANVHSAAATFSETDRAKRFAEKREFAGALRWVSAQDQPADGGAAATSPSAVADRVRYTDYIVGRWEQAAGQIFSRPNAWTQLDRH